MLSLNVTSVNIRECVCVLCSVCGPHDGPGPIVYI